MSSADCIIINIHCTYGKCFRFSPLVLKNQPLYVCLEASFARVKISKMLVCFLEKLKSFHLIFELSNFALTVVPGSQ